MAFQHVSDHNTTLINWSAVSAALASFVGVIQGPLAVVASTLSIVWLSLQIYGWFEKRKHKRKL